VVEPLVLAFERFSSLKRCLHLFGRILSASIACVLWECDKKHLGA